MPSENLQLHPTLIYTSLSSTWGTPVLWLGVGKNSPMPTLKARNSKLPTLAFRSDLLFPLLNLNFDPHHHITTSPRHHITTSPHHHITTSPHHHTTIIIISSIISNISIISSISIISNISISISITIIIIIIIVLILTLILILILSSWSSSSSLLMDLPHMSHRSQVVTNRAAIMSVANGQKLITEASSRYRRVQSSSFWMKCCLSLCVVCRQCFPYPILPARPCRITICVIC